MLAAPTFEDTSFFFWLRFLSSTTKNRTTNWKWVRENAAIDSNNNWWLGLQYVQRGRVVFDFAGLLREPNGDTSDKLITHTERIPLWSIGNRLVSASRLKLLPHFEQSNTQTHDNRLTHRRCVACITWLMWMASRRMQLLVRLALVHSSETRSIIIVIFISKKFSA